MVVDGKSYYSLAEIQEMQNNGYSKEVIDYFLAVYHHYQPLIEQISIAFADVKLEDGIGIWEGEALDNYAQAEEKALYRAKDEREDWHKLINDDLNTCFCSLSYLDAKGMRFCLPAYMIADITEVYYHHIGYSLISSLADQTDFTPYALEQFSLFNRQQKDAVIAYLTYPSADVEIAEYGDDNEIDSKVQRAIDNFWSK